MPLGMHPAIRLACDAAITAALLFLAAAQPVRAQNATSPAASGEPSSLAHAAAPPAAPTSAIIPAPAPSQAPTNSASAPPQAPCQQLLPAPSPQAPDAWHCITVTFAYDFKQTPPCAAAKPVHPCVAQFGIYETTAGMNKTNAVPLFNVALPPNPKGVVTGITQQSPKPMDLALGWHRLCVAALDNRGTSSTLQWCQTCGTWIYVQSGPTPSPSTSVPCNSSTPPATPPPASPPASPSSPGA
jgi:hypothetical protein